MHLTLFSFIDGYIRVCYFALKSHFYPLLEKEKEKESSVVTTKYSASQTFPFCSNGVVAR